MRYSLTILAVLAMATATQAQATRTDIPEGGKVKGQMYELSKDWTLASDFKTTKKVMLKKGFTSPTDLTLHDTDEVEVSIESGKATSEDYLLDGVDLPAKCVVVKGSLIPVSFAPYALGGGYVRPGQAATPKQLTKAARDTDKKVARQSGAISELAEEVREANAAAKRAEAKADRANSRLDSVEDRLDKLEKRPSTTTTVVTSNPVVYEYTYICVGSRWVRHQRAMGTLTWYPCH